MSTNDVMSSPQERTGIVWTGTVDQTQAGLYNNLGTALFLGRFRRGRTDKPMTITSSNIKSKLGYDPENPDYIAVQGALDKNVDSVQVLNIGTITE